MHPAIKRTAAETASSKLRACLDADEMYLLFWGTLHFGIVSKSQCVPLLLGVVPTCCKAKIVQKDMQCFLLTVVSALVHVKPRGPALFKDHYFNIISLQHHRSTNTYSPGDAVKLLFLIVTLIACSPSILGSIKLVVQKHRSE